MAWSIRYQPAAIRDLEQISRWYDEQAPGQTRRFFDELTAIEKRLLEHPILGTPVNEVIRRMLMPQFPYAIYYLQRAQQIVILTVRHGKRKPRLWTVSEPSAAYAP